VRTAGTVNVSWVVTHALPGLRFSLYRELPSGTLTDLTPLPIRARPGAGRRYHVADVGAPLVRPLDYWILARTPAGRWSWHGPLESA
jgi:hypothetical protein